MRNFLVPPAEDSGEPQKPMSTGAKILLAVGAVAAFCGVGWLLFVNSHNVIAFWTAFLGIVAALVSLAV